VTLNSGDVLVNRYRIVKLVGQGGFGAVYRAWDTSLKVPVAVKENLDTSAEAQRQFEHEAQLLAPLRHPNLPRVSDHFFIPGQGQYLVMDFVEGKSLEALLGERGGPLGEAEALGWIGQVCDALEYLHSRTPPIIHRDIKPQNIIITADGRATLVDFGISKAYDPTLTTTRGARAVTPGFSPPEQYGMGKTDARSDVYALGATLYTLLTGSAPPESVALIAGGETLPPIRRLNPGVNPATEAAVAAAMTLAASQRLSGAGALREALAGRAVAPLSQVGRTVALPASGGRRGAPAWLLAVVGLAVVALLAVGAFWMLGDRDGGATPEPTTAAVAQVAATGAASEVAATTLPTATPAATETAITPSPAATFNSDATEYTVQPGDTLGAIAARFSVTAEQLVAFNDLSNPDVLDAGTVLRLPPAGGSPSPAATPANRRIVSLAGGVGSEQVLVPAGAFLMGADDEDADEDEAPVHEVRLDAFWLDAMEVTNVQYAAFVANAGYVTTDELDGIGYTIVGSNFADVSGANWRHPLGPDSDIVGQDDLPVTMVSYDDARAYCVWAGGRLPTEAEWEYAARGPSAPLYPWGDVFSEQRVNACDRNCPMSWAEDTIDDGYTFAAAVGTFGGGVSWVGAEDMAGNVWEWTVDWYDENYYAQSPVDNPTGPSGSVDEDGKSVRGGAWSSTPQGVRSTTRVSVGAWRGHFDVGIRCAYDAALSQVDNVEPTLVSNTDPPPGADIRFVTVPAGPFVRGSTPDDPRAFDDEHPQRVIEVDIFRIALTETTNREFAGCVAAGACRAPQSDGSSTHSRYYGTAEYAEFPVVNVTWKDAADFCGWAGGRLPTEAEWEKAARGPDGAAYPWGNTAPSCALANYNACVGDTTMVGAYPSGAGPYGALDMAGNVWEWVADWYSSDYYAVAPDANPPGPSSGEGHAFRGGAWDDEAGLLRAAYRDAYLDPSFDLAYVGFRCAWD